MAKDYRDISFTYNTTTETIQVRTDRESVNRIGASSRARTLDLTEYHQYITTNVKRIFTYTFSALTTDVLTFFTNAHDAFLAGYTVQITRELDDGTTETFDVNLAQPQYQDDNVTSDTGEKVYLNFSITVSEV